MNCVPEVNGPQSLLGDLFTQIVVETRGLRNVRD